MPESKPDINSMIEEELSAEDRKSFEGSEALQPEGFAGEGRKQAAATESVESHSAELEAEMRRQEEEKINGQIEAAVGQPAETRAAAGAAVISELVKQTIENEAAKYGPFVVQEGTEIKGATADYYTAGLESVQNKVAALLRGQVALLLESKQPASEIRKHLQKKVDQFLPGWAEAARKKAKLGLVGRKPIAQTPAAKPAVRPAAPAPVKGKQQLVPTSIWQEIAHKLGRGGKEEKKTGTDGR